MSAERSNTSVIDANYGATDEPIIRHWGWKHDPMVALCGARLIGVPAPASHPFFCDECERLHAEWLALYGKRP